MPRKKKLPTEAAPEGAREGNALVKIHASINRDEPISTLVYKTTDGQRKWVFRRD